MLDADEAKECIGLFFKNKVDLHLCWNYFVKKYECVGRCPNNQFSQGKDYFSANHIQFSFKELENVDKENKFFYLARNCSIFNQWQSFCYDCISDRFGFTLLHMSSGVLEVYYHDTQKKFTSYIKISVIIRDHISIKLVNRMVWIFNGTMGSYHCSVDAIFIKSK